MPSNTIYDGFTRSCPGNRTSNPARQRLLVCHHCRSKRVLIADERYEAACVIDVDNDGVLDIVSGAYVT